jgi:hypothetical protein
VSSIDFADPIVRIVIGATVGTMGATALLYRLLPAWIRRRRLVRRLRSCPLTSVAEAKDGTVKLAGRVRLAKDSLTAPISGRRCAGYQVHVIESWRLEEAHSALLVEVGAAIEAKTVVAEVRCLDFSIDDGSGIAWVRGSGRALELVHNVRRRSGIWKEASPVLEAFLERHGQTSKKADATSRQLKYTEGALEEGDEVVVLGEGSWELDPGPAAGTVGYRESAMRFVVGQASPIFGALADDLLISNDPAVVMAGTSSRAK